MEQVLSQDRRDSQRVPYPMKVLVQYSDMAWVADVLDLSTGGCGIYRPAGFLLSPGNVAHLFFFEGCGPAVRVSACIARITERHIGFEYHEPQHIPPTPG